MKKLAKQFQISICLVFTIAVFQNALSAQQKSRVHVKIVTSDTRKITPAMVCITNISSLRVHLPPDGAIAMEPTYPDIFFTGINFNHVKNWVGPVRKMSGKGAVNGQRTYVYGEAPTLPYWNEPVMYQVSGDFTIDLEPGTWRISIEHGNEYIPVTSELNVTARSKEQTKIFVLIRWINLPKLGWYSGDVHAHHPLTKPEFREYVLQLAKAEDVHLLNILQMGDREHTYFQPQGFGDKFHILRGNTAIVSGQEEPRSNYGHIIGLNTGALERDTAAYNLYDIVFNRIHNKQQALVGYAHFAYGGEGVKEGLAIYAPTGAINFLELLQNTQMNTNDYYNYLNLGFRLTAAAGSDFPWGSTIGDGRTYVYTGHSFSAAKWFEGMKKGNTFVSNGPALFMKAAGNLPGAEVKKHKGEQITIAVKALSNPQIGVIEKVQLFNNDGLLMEVRNAKHLNSVSLTITHQLLKSQWVTAAVYCSNGALAHTSPIYFIVDGKSWYDTAKGPAIVKKLLVILDNAKKAESSRQIIDSGVIERIEKAELYYKRLMQ